MLIVKIVIRPTNWMRVQVLLATIFALTLGVQADMKKQQISDDEAAFTAALNGEWEAVFFDDCTGDYREKWFLDGEIAAVRNRFDGMQLSAGPQPRNNAHHMVLWTQEEFSGDLKIEFEYTRTDFEAICVNILYIQATGMGVGPYLSDISQWNELRRVPAMAMYHDYMNTYHISYAAYPNEQDPSEDYVRARRYMPMGDEVAEGLGQGLEATDLEPDYFKTGLFQPGKQHHFSVIKKGQELFMRISNDEQTRYFYWKNDKAPGIDHGRIGLRHMWGRSALYKNFRVSQPK